jgi:hypothetical protein
LVVTTKLIQPGRRPLVSALFWVLVVPDAAGLGFRFAIHIETVDRAVDVEGDVVLGEAHASAPPVAAARQARATDWASRVLLHDDCLRYFLIDVTSDARTPHAASLLPVAFLRVVLQRTAS